MCSFIYLDEMRMLNSLKLCVSDNWIFKESAHFWITRFIWSTRAVTSVVLLEVKLYLLSSQCSVWKKTGGLGIGRQNKNVNKFINSVFFWLVCHCKPHRDFFIRPVGWFTGCTFSAPLYMPLEKKTKNQKNNKTRVRCSFVYSESFLL